MNNPCDKLQALRERDEDSKRKLAEEIDALSNTISSLMKKETEYAKQLDLDALKKCTSERKRAEETRESYQKLLDEYYGYTDDDVRTEWDAFVPELVKSIAPDVSKLYDATESLLPLVMDVIEEINDAYLVRSRMESYIKGTGYPSFNAALCREVLEENAKMRFSSMKPYIELFKIQLSKKYIINDDTIKAFENGTPLPTHEEYITFDTYAVKNAFGKLFKKK